MQQHYTTLFWDGPEVSLNPVLMTEVIAVLLSLARNGVQIFLTRHSSVILKELDLVCPAPWFTDNKVGRGVLLTNIRAMNAVEAANPENFIPFLEIPDLIASLDGEQMDILAMDFPVLGVAGKMAPFFTWLRRHPEDGKRLKEGQGVPLNASLLHALTETPRLLPPPLTGDLLPQSISLTNLTLYFTDTETPLPPGIELPETLLKDYLRARIATLSIKNKGGEAVKTLGGCYFAINPQYRFAHGSDWSWKISYGTRSQRAGSSPGSALILHTFLLSYFHPQNISATIFRVSRYVHALLTMPRYHRYISIEAVWMKGAR